MSDPHAILVTNLTSDGRKTEPAPAPAAAAAPATEAKTEAPATSEKKLPTVVFVLGGPGSGKGTQCERIVKEFGFSHLSAGDLLRAEVASKSPHGEMIDEMIKAGKIVPAEVTVGLLKTAIAKRHAEEGKSRFLVDGFPRNDDNDRVWRAQMTGVAETAFVLFFECTEEVMLTRLLKRGETSGRKDDNEESIKKRFHTFHTESMPVVETYEKAGKVRKVDATKTPDEVFASIRPLFEKL